MPARRSDQSKVAEEARKGLRPWRSVRKAAIQLWRKLNEDYAHVCQIMRVTRQWLHKWVKRWHDNGKTWESLDDKSSRPLTIHIKRHAHTEGVIEAKKSYPHLGAGKLKIIADIPLSADTINRILVENGAITPRRKTRRKYCRFQRPFPNYLWQMDITQTELATGPWAHILTIIDDHSRFILASRIFKQELTSGDVIDVVRHTIRMWGKPRQILTDRGCQFTTNSDYPGIFALTLHQWGIHHIKARPRHPRTLGKIERWHKSLKHEWLSRHTRPNDLSDLRRLLDTWIDHYNNRRPHFALKYGVPVDIYSAGFMTPEAVWRLVNEVV